MVQKNLTNERKLLSQVGVQMVLELKEERLWTQSFLPSFFFFLYHSACSRSHTAKPWLPKKYWNWWRWSKLLVFRPPLINIPWPFWLSPCWPPFTWTQNRNPKILRVGVWTWVPTVILWSVLINFSMSIGLFLTSMVQSTSLGAYSFPGMPHPNPGAALFQLFIHHFFPFPFLFFVCEAVLLGWAPKPTSAMINQMLTWGLVLRAKHFLSS